MPPQPLSRVRPKADAIADPGALRRVPAIAAHVGEIVATWARIESTLGITLAGMLDAGVRASVAIYAAILNSKAQMDALEAAAKVTLEPKDFKLFGAVIILIKRAGSKRHKLAHWLWGYAPEIKDALLLFDPNAVLDLSVATSVFIKSVINGNYTTEERSTLDKSRVFVYREKDMLEILNEVQNVDAISRKFAALAFRPDAAGAAQLRTQLLAEPQIQEALRRIRE
jgi:hypothetical protein